ncbi:hypothetical protein BDZ89DRAFT_1127121 [Hymenopellis radicata]|nr:hypothetical protein BDZ89DRAFT_1127121 [Hymenopellis radicata]
MEIVLDSQVLVPNCNISSQRASYNPPPQSSAQTCNDDVLDIIFAFLSKPDVASAAKTCKSWSASAYRALYASVAFHPSYVKGDILMELLSPTLMESDLIRHLIRHLSIDASMVSARHISDHVYDWLLLLPANTILSLTLFTSQVHEKFMDILLHSPALPCIRYLNLKTREPFYCGVNWMSQLLASAPNVSHLSVMFATLEDTETLPQYYAPWTRVPCRVRHLFASMQTYTSVFGDLLALTHASLETLICKTIDGRLFHSELMRALETTFPSPIQTVFLCSQHNLPLLIVRPGAWGHLRELVLSGWQVQWDLLSECLPPSLETLVLGFIFFKPFPVEQLVAFVDRTHTSSSVFSRLIICGAPRHYIANISRLDDVCSRCGVSLQIYSDAISCPSLLGAAAWTLQAMLATMRLSPA